MKISPLFPRYAQFSKDRRETHKENTGKTQRDSDILSPQEIHGHLETREFGHTILHTSCTNSTNDDAKENADSFPHGTLFTCDTQTSGKGRFRRRWASPRGGLFLSLILKPQIPPSEAPGLSLVTGYSVTRVLKSFGLDALVKWPNDVLIKEGKVAGILSEMSLASGKIEYIIVGIGVNANLPGAPLTAALGRRITSVMDELKKPVDRNLLAAKILNLFELHYFRFLKSGIESLTDEIQASMAYLGKRVTIQNTASDYKEEERGTLHGIDSRGNLVLAATSGEIKVFTAGEVSLKAN